MSSIKIGSSKLIGIVVDSVRSYGHVFRYKEHYLFVFFIERPDNAYRLMKITRDDSRCT